MGFEITKIQDFISMRAFLYGTGGVLLGFAALFSYVALNADKTVEALESRLASQSVVIAMPPQTQPPAAPPSAVPTAEPPPLADATADAEPVNADHALAGSEQDLDVYLLDGEGAQTTKALAVAPIEGLYENTPFGPLPKIMPDGKTPFTVYKKPFVLNREKPALAVAVLGYGLSAQLSETLLKELPAPVSFILSPYAQTPEEWQKKARANGHEIWLQLLFETADFPKTDPGAMGLMSSVSIKYNQDRLNWALGRTAGYAGIAALTDRTLEKASPMFKTIAADIFNRGLGFFELGSGNFSFMEPLAVEANSPAIRNFMPIGDFPPKPDALTLLEDKLKTVGGAAVVVIPTPGNIGALKDWLQSLEQSGVNLVPVSALAALSVKNDE
jgi:polysaccharide deacetylase 2 family uncharacterized protein YibQ